MNLGSRPHSYASKAKAKSAIQWLKEKKVLKITEI